MNSYAEVMQTVLTGAGKSFVVFEEGTVVVIVSNDADIDLNKVATDTLKENGPVQAGGPGGDFSVITLNDGLGWAVTSHHPDILTIVLADELDDPKELGIGLHGRGKRGTDAESLKIVHTQDNRSA